MINHEISFKLLRLLSSFNSLDFLSFFFAFLGGSGSHFRHKNSKPSTIKVTNPIKKSKIHNTNNPLIQTNCITSKVEGQNNKE